jgi:predicted Fe-Mo cluster-binding NifX family protein
LAHVLFCFLFVKVAIPTWELRVSPVFDVARRLLVVDLESNAEASREEMSLDETQVARRARRVAELGVDVLICGGVSKPLEAALVSAGVRVISEICGSVEDVLRAFVSGDLANGAFLMPGCCRRRQRYRAQRQEDRRKIHRKETFHESTS